MRIEVALGSSVVDSLTSFFAAQATTSKHPKTKTDNTLGLSGSQHMSVNQNIRTSNPHNSLSLSFSATG